MWGFGPFFLFFEEFCIGKDFTLFWKNKCGVEKIMPEGVTNVNLRERNVPGKKKNWTNGKKKTQMLN